MVDLTSGSTGSSAADFSVASDVFELRGPSSGCRGYRRGETVSCSIILGRPKLALWFRTRVSIIIVWLTGIPAYRKHTFLVAPRNKLADLVQQFVFSGCIASGGEYVPEL